MSADFYRIIVAYLLTFVVAWELQQLKKHIQLIFSERQNQSTDETRMQSLTLMIVAQNPQQYLTSDIIGEFEAYVNKNSSVKHRHVMGIYHIPNLRKAYDRLCDLKVNEMSRDILLHLDLPKSRLRFVSKKIKDEAEFDAYYQKTIAEVHDGVMHKTNRTGITFVSFKSIDSLIAFQAFIRRCPKQPKRQKRRARLLRQDRTQEVQRPLLHRRH
jgi:hypothetical protein